MSKITFSEKAWEEYMYWQVTDKNALKKINKLLKEIQRTILLLFSVRDIIKISKCRK